MSRPRWGNGAVNPKTATNTYACDMLAMEDGGLLLLGSSGPSTYLDGYVVKTDARGETLWQQQLGAEGPVQDYFHHACRGSNGKVLLMGTSGSYSAIQGGSRAYLVQLSAAGEPEMDSTVG